MNPDEIAAHVNFYNNGDFLRDLFAWTVDQWPPARVALRERFTVSSLARDLVLICHRVDLPYADEGDELVVNEVVFGPKSKPPFSLDWTGETPAGAREKLCADTAGTGPAISHFMPEGLVVCPTFAPGMVGLAKVVVVRLGAVQDWRAR
jgi:hypothetical protein